MSYDRRSFEEYEQIALPALKALNDTTVSVFNTSERIFSIAYYCIGDNPENAKQVFKWTAVLKDRMLQAARETMDPAAMDFYYRALKLEAPFLFDSYMLYLEKNREPNARFYLPKRPQLQKIGLVQTLQDLEDDVLDLASVSMPPGTGKTTVEKFFTTWVIGRKPNDYSLFYSHSSDITRMYFDGVLDICTNDEYTFGEIFPESKIHNINAKRQQINFNSYKPFANLQTASIGSKNAGRVRVSENGYLLCDDLIGGIEEAMSIDQLEKRWAEYSVDARQRKKDGAKELHVATRWSVNDVIGRLQRAYEGTPAFDRMRFIAVPDIDPETGESNFMYAINGMSVDFFHDQERLMDEVSYRCLYKNDPIEREGLLYHISDFERYLDLPTDDPDAILGVCDTKDKGTDFCCMPIFYQYGDRYFLHDLVYNNGPTELCEAEMEDVLVRTDPHQVQFESNSAGGRVADDMRERVKKHKLHTSITKKYTTANKETKIIQNSPWVKEHVILRDPSTYDERSEYAKFVKDVCSYTIAGKNKHDDGPDALAMFAEFTRKLIRPAYVVSNPFA